MDYLFCVFSLLSIKVPFDDINNKLECCFVILVMHGSRTVCFLMLLSHYHAIIFHFDSLVWTAW